jgi:hypothetical protein
MKINPILYNDIFIRYDCLLAFTDHLDLIDDLEMKNKITQFHLPDGLIYKDHKFYMVRSEKIKEKDLNNFTIGDYAAYKELLYLTNDSKII